MINGVVAPWKPGDPPTKGWESIRATYWTNKGEGGGQFTLGKFSELARFFASSRSAQAIIGEPVVAPSSHVFTMASRPQPGEGVSLAAGAEE
jgi:hypothetical protein